jgi:hypothetical protein
MTSWRTGHRVAGQLPPGTVHFSLHPDDGQALRRPEEDATTGGLIDEEGSLVCEGGG